MNLSKFFIDRPIFAGVLSLLILLAGVIALRGLPISEYPEVVPPTAWWAQRHACPARTYS
jgi:multidrug efflux pump